MVKYGCGMQPTESLFVIGSPNHSFRPLRPGIDLPAYGFLLIVAVASLSEICQM
jgi:hypothetical protein